MRFIVPDSRTQNEGAELMCPYQWSSAAPQCRCSNAVVLWV